MSALPGVSDAHRLLMNLQARTELEQALAQGRAPGALLLHIEPDDAHIEDRGDFVLHLRRCGAFTIARHIERAKIPVGHLLAFVDTDDITTLAVVPIDALGLELDQPDRPAVLTPTGGASA